MTTSQPGQPILALLLSVGANLSAFRMKTDVFGDVTRAFSNQGPHINVENCFQWGYFNVRCGDSAVKAVSYDEALSFLSTHLKGGVS